MQAIRRAEVEITRPTARTGLDRTIRRAEHTSATTECGILAHEEIERASVVGPIDGDYFERRAAVALARFCRPDA